MCFDGQMPQPEWQISICQTSLTRFQSVRQGFVTEIPGDVWQNSKVFPTHRICFLHIVYRLEGPGNFLVFLLVLLMCPDIHHAFFEPTCACCTVGSHASLSVFSLSGLDKKSDQKIIHVSESIRARTVKRFHIIEHCYVHK